MLRKKTSGVSNGPRLAKALNGVAGSSVDRRTFLKRSGLAASGIAAGSALSFGTVKKAEAAASSGGGMEKIISVCTHCSVGCAIDAEVKGGVWVGQEPNFDSPFNLGGHCAKGASVREHAHGERRARYPMKLEGGKWKRVSWDQAVNDIGDKMLGRVRRQIDVGRAGVRRAATAVALVE